MSIRMFLAVGVLAAVTAMPAFADKDADKAALQPLNDFIGTWKGDASAKTGTKDESWKETVDWSWKIGKDDMALGVKFTGGKSQFEEGLLKYDASKKKYTLTLAPKEEKLGGKGDLVFTGEFKTKKLLLERVDAATKDKTTLEMYVLPDGPKLLYNVAVQKKSFGIAKKGEAYTSLKEGANVAGGKKPECVVTGGAGTMAVSYGGKTYYVCCSGCRDEFNANPKKYVDEFEKNKGK